MKELTAKKALSKKVLNNGSEEEMETDVTASKTEKKYNQDVVDEAMAAHHDHTVQQRQSCSMVTIPVAIEAQLN
jgi:hypothetical protein